MTVPASTAAIPVFLVQRMLVGILLGTTIVVDDEPDFGAVSRQVVLIAALFFSLMAWLLVKRPFLVCIASIFEAAIALCQGMCTLMNLWLVSVTGTVLGITMSEEEALARMHGLLLAATVWRRSGS